MAYSECCRGKLAPYKIGGQSKPFIDKNLQLQLPEWDLHPCQADRSFTPIYSHYAGSAPPPYFSSQVNEGELYQAIKEAEYSYEAWKQMQQQLKEAAKAYQL